MFGEGGRVEGESAEVFYDSEGFASAVEVGINNSVCGVFHIRFDYTVFVSCLVGGIVVFGAKENGVVPPPARPRYYNNKITTDSTCGPGSSDFGIFGIGRVSSSNYLGI